MSHFVAIAMLKVVKLKLIVFVNASFSAFKFSAYKFKLRFETRLFLRPGMGDNEHPLCFSLYQRFVIAFCIMIHVGV